MGVISSPHSPRDDWVTFKQHIYCLGNVEFSGSHIGTFQAEGNGRGVDGCNVLGPAVILLWYIAWYHSSLGSNVEQGFQ